ncbi:aminoglycoside phosphotransferase family protein [Bogoriella caseilytica]|uniref:Aminoglycoside phosphotransferase (APT) family kinase protein n=1 Tax=Bogoriella caseilytica TaxID=56055 RepID=A0A3N2B9H5_9MICO|nr:aminoglycoside phosphotransferase family protein [Bogoriella caseilytica]ROR71907.1 aminoglycoside phosphotransferase (APT) family kinase protein [Bogoriella caseilytica]
MTVAGSGTRITWDDLPVRVRQTVQDVLGDAVVSAVSQPGGFSVGTADRVLTDTGRRAFVKAVAPHLNEHTPAMHRREIEIAGVLPSHLPAPRLLGSYDDGTWVVAILEDVDGRHPQVPWSDFELDAVLSAVRELGAVRAAELESAGVTLRSLADDLAHEFTGWSRVAADPPPKLDPWAAARLDLLTGLAATGLQGARGDALVHGDLRADNILLTEQGPVLVDWPWTVRGGPWIDTLTVLLDAVVSSPSPQSALTDAEARLARWLPDAAPGCASGEAVTGFLAGLAGMWADAARLPAPPGMAKLREFQRREGAAALAWLRLRLRS